MRMTPEMREKRHIPVVRRQYEKEGYRVIVAPHGADLPDFLAATPPDMIAYRDSEAVAIEVRTGYTLSAKPALSDMVQAVESHPGWRVDLAVTNPRYPSPGDTAPDIAIPDIEARLGAARNLVQTGQIEAALLLAWSATEATLRHIATQNRVELERPEALYAIEKLRMYGLLTQEEHRALVDAARLHEAVAHGYSTEKNLRESVETLLGMTRALLEYTPGE